MPYFIVLLLSMVLSFTVSADQRIDQNNHDCHFVKPPPNTNSANEVKLDEGCFRSIDEDDDNDTATGKSYIQATYTERTLPVSESVTFTGNGGDINCNLADANGNNYSTTDWMATYTVQRRRGYDHDEGKRGNGRVPRDTDPVIVKFELECYDAPKQ
jgi:hypothetical protein